MCPREKRFLSDWPDNTQAKKKLRSTSERYLRVQARLCVQVIIYKLILSPLGAFLC